jgi:uncharacterized membrane protein
MKSGSPSYYRFASSNDFFKTVKSKRKMETKRTYQLLPRFGTSYNTGWKVMADNFLRLLLVVIILGIIASPMTGAKAQWKFDAHDFSNIPWNMDEFFKFGAFGIAAAFLGLLAMMYYFLLLPVFKYGAKMMFVQSVRQKTPDFDLLISGFRKNYLNIVLANLLVTALIGIGIVCLFVPGIIIACRLAFTPYLVMDKELDPIKAAEESWRLTRGHGWKIFAMGFVAFFIYIAGFICFFIGVLVSDMWVKSSYATLYQSVLISKGLYQAEEEPTVSEQL